MCSSTMPENSGLTRLMWHQPALSSTLVLSSVSPLLKGSCLACAPRLVDGTAGDPRSPLHRAGSDQRRSTTTLS